ncbi:GNAT family N-acetyltransferase [Streptomyces sp. AM 2-1-1]|uniref:GNAT family N-acetyltransferase n=1 Tax=Streptomyces sp. AM 2-1-1 TaxID=3028709 RepID=UPI0023BA3513|nr:GNAT family N-acetyltransferase [Streptomyces sp. AM 2-1-1]WEH38202.1 GNAT family N-acetyltransferase [Streptomyces sp. AM 2-1-1]
MSTDLQSPHSLPRTGPAPGSGPARPGGPAPHLLDNAAWAALNGPHRRFAEIVGSAARYQTDVAPFVALGDAADPRAWDDLAALVGPGAVTAVTGIRSVPDHWETVQQASGVQLVADTLRTRSDPEAVRLTPADVPEMLDLVSRAKPGPFLPRTIELGAYWGIRRGGRLVAMAGERLRPPGHTEISAVCTDAGHRGQGLATRLVRHVADGIRDRGDVPFLHAAGDNENAIRLYLSIGFALRVRTLFAVVRVPGGDPAAAPGI